MKPSWENAPYWANYLARDKNGNWYWYENEPIGFNSDDEWICGDGRAEIARNESHTDWKQTLEQR